MGQTADEILDNLTEDEIAAYTADSATEEHIVIGADRFITVPDELKRIAVQFDHNVETVTFDCPRYWDDIDMSIMRIYINYMRPDGQKGTFVATDISVDRDDSNIMHFNWTVSKEVTMVKGQISFLVCITKIDDAGNEVNHWNSELNREMTISEGLECQEVIAEEYADVISDLLQRMDNLTGAVNGELLEDIIDEQEALNTDNEVINSSISLLQGRMNIAEDNISKLEADLSETNDDVKGLDTRVLTNERAIDDLESRTSANDNNILALQAKMTDLESNGVVGTGDFTELENRVATNEQNIATNQNDITNLKADLNAAKGDIQQNVMDIEQINFTIQELQTAVADIDASLTSIINEESF